jgi:(1->4)-alpha-D-glucan 1-alpha-D-glucosylmutase
MRATYRLQLTPSFGFAPARALVPYLRDLGVSHLYLSPVLQARRGSQHGYDVVDPTRVSAELGGEDELRRLCDAAHAEGLGILLDIVPNHMARSDENPYWRDEELRVRFFDVDPERGWHRRFFTIGDLVGVRQTVEGVFDETHRKVLELVADGAVDGLRIDHVDGLADPAGYVERLRARGVRRVWVEKILEPGERLRDWPVEGTTGYEFANDVTALFVDPAGEPVLDDLCAELTGDGRSFAEVAREAKLEVAREEFTPELRRLGELYEDPRLAEAVASLPVYRSYVQPFTGDVAEEDRDALAAVHEPLRRTLLLEGERTDGLDELVVRFQQTSGAVMAKGVEDTAFYRYLRLLALNEVGGDPGRFSLGVDEFHRANAERARRFPDHLLASQTHDAKRSGDVRARIVALTGVAPLWAGAARRMVALCEPLREERGPDGAELYLILQTLAGVWPIELDRLCAAIVKSLREAGRRTSWTAPDEAHEQAVEAFLRRALAHRPLLDELEPLVREASRRGREISLAATLLRLAAPGVCDIYQGDELELLSLVDPDNRRPVDFTRRARLLDALRAGAAPTVETAKLAVIQRALALRVRRPEAFAGTYVPLSAGPDTCAFLRGDDVAVIVALREGPRAAVELPPGPWSDLLEDVPCAPRLELLERVRRAG